ncbi:MAG: amidohydrolase, partial [Deltaproteobacteria bacterium]|nr:amidohydrolase [Deltaproteobacteria bacterium]
IVLTQNESGEIIENGALAITGPMIVAVGPRDEIMAEHGAGARVLTGKRALVMPGLINAHTHVSMTCFRGLADDLPLETWLNEAIFPAEKKLTGEIVYCGAMLGCAEMILSGTTFFCDMYLFEHEVARAVEQSGLRALLGEVLYDFPSPNYGPSEAGLEFTANLIDQWQGHERINIAVEPHALYTCSPDLLKACRDLADQKKAPLIIHASETQDEVSTIKNQYGVTPIHHLSNLGLLSSNLIADHCVVLEDDEIALLAARGVKVVHNPSSNMKLASGVSPVPEMLNAGVCVGLGTDGAASNNNLDMFSEMDLAAKLHKSFKLDPTVMDANTVLNMATSGGAETLNMHDKLGRLAPGCLADLIVLDMSQPHLTPLYNPMSHLVYAASGADVIHTVVHGKVLMEDRRLLTLDLEEIYGRMDEISKIMAEVVKS